MKYAAALTALAVASAAARADKIAELPAVRALHDELARSMASLALPGVDKPYYLSYELVDEQTAHVEASLGAIIAREAAPHRMVDIDLRVGDYALDSSNFAAGFGQHQSITLGVETDYDAIRHELWLATDRAYKSAGEMLERKQAVLKEEAKSADEAPSFSKDTPASVLDVAPAAPAELGKLESIATELSALFRRNHDAYRATVSVYYEQGNRYFESSEGALEAEPFRSVRVIVSCSTQADDGMPLADSLVFDAATPDQLPSQAQMTAQVEQLVRELSALRAAPIVDDYAGPVLVRGVAAGQLIRALVAEDFSGTPAPKGDHPGAQAIGESELVGKLAQRILPPGTTVIDDPTGHYRFDDEGIAPQKVTLVENGMFKRFLMSRTPRKGFEHSTGHGRSSMRAPVRAHPSNLIVTTSKGVADREIVKRAVAAAKDQGLPYVLVIDKLGAGDDFDASSLEDTAPRPIVARRIYADGHDQLVRGAAFGAMPLRTLKDVLAMGSTGTPYRYAGSGLPRRYDFMFDAPHGYPVSIVCPALLFRDLDIKKPRGAQRKPPIAPRP